eukprot:3389099-Pleurochrysis_carterae.AAC.1
MLRLKPKRQLVLRLLSHKEELLAKRAAALKRNAALLSLATDGKRLLCHEWRAAQLKPRPERVCASVSHD